MGSSLRLVITMVVAGMAFLNVEAKNLCEKPSVLNGNAVISFNLKTGTITFTYTCNFGYRLVGKDKVGCLVDGSYTNAAPTCELVDCGEATQYTWYTVVTNPTSTTTYNSKLIYSCRPGYTLMGSSERYCQEDGTWSSEPYCDKDCPTPKNIANGTWTITTPTSPRVVHYSCNSPYKLIGSDTRWCVYDGTWSGTQPYCVSPGYSCVVPTVLNAYAMDFYDAHTEITTYEFACHGGYRQIGYYSVDCLANGSYTNAAPRCEPVDCGEVTKYTLNAIVNNPTKTTTYNSKLIYSCPSGYTLVGLSERYCQYDGNWTAEPTCDKDCPTPIRIPNGMLYTNTPRMVYYSCNSPYKLSGNDTRWCESDGTWSGTQPTCVSPDE